MKKIILNKSFGGFDLSEEAYRLYAKKKGLEIFKYKPEIQANCKWIYRKTDSNDIFTTYFTKDFGNNVEISEEDFEKYLLCIREDKREDKTLIEVVEELGEKASGRCGRLKVIEIPKNAFYVIENYDGAETLYYSHTEIMSK